MCVILEKIAGKEIPFEHLLAGAHRNPDGYGVVVHDGSKLEVIQGLADPELAAKKVQEVLAGAKDQQAYVHFRFRTVGDVSVENTHPICVLRKDKDGVDLQFMHNGTISKMHGHGDRSDSAHFAEHILAPLARRSAHYLGPDEVTSDPLIADILARYAEGVSKFVLFDGNGNSLVINRQSGVEQAYGWSSNAYSVDPKNIPREKEDRNVIYSSAWPKKSDHQALVDTLQSNAGRSSSAVTCSPSVRLTVQEITGLKTDAFMVLDPEQVREMVTNEPDLTAILILDLLAEKYQSEFRKAA